MTTTPTPWNAISQVSATAGSSSDANIVAMRDGGYLVLWVDDSNPAKDVVGQRYDALGHKVGKEIDLDHRTTSSAEPAAALLSNGKLAVAFTDLTNEQIIVQRYDASLKSVATDALGAGDGPTISAFSDGGYVVAKIVFDGNDSNIFFRTVSATGVVGTEKAVATGAGFDLKPEVAALSSGDFAVIYSTGNGDSDVHLQVRHRNGDFVLQDTFVAGAGDPAEFESDAQIGALRKGGFVVTWTDENGDADSHGIRATIYTDNGTPLSALATDFQVNTTAAGDQEAPLVTALSDGSFIIAWVDTEIQVVRGQRFAANGTTIGEEFTIDVQQETDAPAHAIELRDGRIAFGFAGDNGFGSAIRTEILDPRSSPILGTSTADRLTSRIDGATVKGLKGDDVLYGFGGKDNLLGGKGEDTLKGGKGADVLNGGKGADKLYAGKGDAADVFVFHRHDSGVGDGSVDKIFGFDRENGHEKVHDVIDLSALHVKLKDIDLDHHKHSVTLLVDTHGSSKPDFAIEVMKVADLNPGDLLL